MRALRCLEYGSCETLVVEDLPDPLPGEGEVVVDVAAAAVNFPDVLLVADQYQVHHARPVHAGERVRRHRAGGGGRRARSWPWGTAW
jgi:NADPH2:quinone reductase